MATRGAIVSTNTSTPNRVIPRKWAPDKSASDKRSADILRKAIISGQHEAESQQQAMRLLRGESVSGRDRKKLTSRAR